MATKRLFSRWARFARRADKAERAAVLMLDIYIAKEMEKIRTTFGNWRKVCRFVGMVVLGGEGLERMVLRRRLRRRWNLWVDKVVKKPKRLRGGMGVVSGIFIRGELGVVGGLMGYCLR